MTLDKYHKDILLLANQIVKVVDIIITNLYRYCKYNIIVDSNKLNRAIFGIVNMRARTTSHRLLRSL